MADLILRIRTISKSFPGVRALTDVTLDVRRGEVHAICGENGAGKSTLMKVLSGVYPHGSYSGEIRLDGNEHAKAGVIDWNETVKSAATLLKRVGLRKNPRARVAGRITIAGGTGTRTDRASRSGRLIEQGIGQRARRGRNATPRYPGDEPD